MSTESGAALAWVTVKVSEQKTRSSLSGFETYIWLVRKQRLHRFLMERFNLKELNEVEGTEQYHVEI
jgi:hypothetical protein